MAADILITIALVTGAVLIINQLARMIRNTSVQRTIRDAVRQNSPSLPDLINRMDETGTRTVVTEQRAGLVLIALALALALAGLIAAPRDDLPNVIALSLFPGFVGAVLLGHAIWLRHHGEGD